MSKDQADQSNDEADTEGATDASDSDDLYDRATKAKAAGGGRYPDLRNDGKYRIEVANMSMITTRKKQTFFICDFYIRSAQKVRPIPPELLKTKYGETETPAPHEVGEHRKFMVDMLEDWGPSIFRGIVLAADGTSDDEAKADPVGTKALLKAAVSKAQPLRGALIDVDSYRAITLKGKNAGQPSTRWGYSIVKSTPEEVAARAAAQGGSTAAE